MTSPFVWSHPRITNADAGKHDREGMAAEAAACLSRREATYPDLVANGKLEAATAEADLAAWRAIATDWRWIATGEGEPADRSTLRARIDALETAIDRFFVGMDRAGGEASLSDLQRRQITCLAAMRWWGEFELHQPSRLHDRDYAAIGHQWRELAGRPTLGALRRQNEREAA